MEKRLKPIWITPLVIALAVASIVVLVVDGVGVSPSLTASIHIGGFGEVDYYASQPIPNVPPGLLVRVFLINGSVIEPVDAFIDVYANAPNGIVHVSMGYSTTLIVPFSNVNWQYVINKWVLLGLLGVSSSEYETSMLIFITYVRGNESWILPLVIPYNVAWAIKNSRYIVVNAFINVNSIKPSEVIPAMPGTTAVNLQLPSNHSDYTTYDCYLSAPKPPPETAFKPEITCLGFNGSLPATWVTLSNGVIQNDEGLQFELNIYFSGTINWDAMAAGYGDIGISYSANENWVLSSPTYTIGSQITQPGSLYWYYGGATWAIVNYTVWFVSSSMGTYHLGNATIFEVLYIPPNSNYVGMVLDYGNGPVSLLYYLASKHYLEYPASIINYAAFVYTGQEYLYKCNGPVTNASTTSGTAYAITLGGVNTAYSLSAAEIGTGLGGLALGISSMLITPSTSSSVTSTYLEFFNVNTGTSLYISVVNASAVYGLPTFGFILNATNYYGGPASVTCKYNQWVQIG
ncbi:hypothetical protein [Caldivirga sp. MU80]|uniref:hypothetical protein n=1 Tax=Caldivirga sp. MU80 TaxID=1650354 RepID=UPI001EE3C9D1|nr:hypothetical protein [Caldivirga sp. MU80]